MSDMAAYLGDKLLNWLRGDAFGTAPTDVYVALYNGDPDAAGTEVTGTVGLTRQAVVWTTVAARAMSNSAEVDFGNASGAASVDYVVLVDTVSGAFEQFGKKSIATATLAEDEKVSIAIGDLALSY